MLFTKYWIADIAKVTAQMSLAEEAIFHRLMRRYLDTELPIPADLEKVFRLIGVKRRTEKLVVTAVLAMHFVAGKDGWHRAEWDELIARAKTQNCTRISAGKTNDINAPKNTATSYKLQATSSKEAAPQQLGLVAPNPEATLFDYWPGVLVTKTGKTEAQCRQLIGLWRKKADGDDPRVLHLLRTMHRQNISDPVSWMSAALKAPEEGGNFDYRTLYPK